MSTIRPRRRVQRDLTTPTTRPRRRAYCDLSRSPPDSSYAGVGPPVPSSLPTTSFVGNGRATTKARTRGRRSILRAPVDPSARHSHKPASYSSSSCGLRQHLPPRTMSSQGPSAYSNASTSSTKGIGSHAQGFGTRGPVPTDAVARVFIFDRISHGRGSTRNGWS